MANEKIKQLTNHAAYASVTESYIAGTIVPKTTPEGIALEGPGANGAPVQVNLVQQIGDPMDRSTYREEIKTFTLAGPSMELVPNNTLPAIQTPAIELEEEPVPGKRKSRKGSNAAALEAMVLKQNAMIANLMQMQATPPTPLTPVVQLNIPSPQKIKVTFTTAQGSITISYLAAIDSPTCLTLVQSPDADTQYSPPINMDEPLRITFDGKTVEVFSIGLSFSFDNKEYTVLVK